MEQFHSFDGARFEESIRNKTNFIRLKANVVNAIKNDPTSSRGEADQALKMLREGCPEIFEEKRDLEYEKLRSDPDTWDEDYFLLYAAYVQDNFCKERIEQFKKIGKKVYGKPTVSARNHTLSQNTVTTQKMPQKTAQPKAATSTRTTPQKSTTPNPTRAPEQKKPPLAAGILIVAVLVLVVLAVCLLGKGTNAHAAAAILNKPEMLPLLPQQLMQMIK